MPFDLGYIWFSGRVVEGVGKRKNELEKEEYRDSFVKKFGIDPKHGTLNIKLDDRNRRKFRRVQFREGFEVNVNNRKFDLFPSEIRRIKSLVFIPQRSKDRIMELVSNYHLRSELGLQENDVVSVKVYVNKEESWVEE